MEDEYVFTSVLVTGGCGFIASNVINHFVKKYPHVTFVNLDCLYYCGTEHNITIQDCENYIFYKGSILDSELIKEIFSKHNIDTILHFAAKTHVDESFEHPERYVINNIKGTFSLLERCREYGRIKRYYTQVLNN
jgi:dTDP-D-glucose 4,6-dehydratase